MSAVRGPLRKHGIRLTRQRELLFELINKSHVHLNADQLYELAKKRDARINRVTVYRTLKILKQEGLIDELDLLHHEGDQHYYETRLKREHAHIVCLRCGSVQEYFGEPLRMLNDQIESDFGFQIAVARTDYNETVRQYNTYIRRFPTVLTAKVVGAQPREYFEVTDPSARTAPKVDFGTPKKDS